MTTRSMSSGNVNCRICLEGGEKESKLLKVCQCSGSQELVHYHCIKSWIESSNRKKCSVCKTVYSGLIIRERAATVKQWITNTPGLSFAVVGNIAIMMFCWYFLLLAYTTSSLADKSNILPFFRFTLTILNCMFTGVMVMYALMGITALICSYKEYSRENKTIQVKGFVAVIEKPTIPARQTVVEIEKGLPIESNNPVSVDQSSFFRI